MNKYRAIRNMIHRLGMQSKPSEVVDALEHCNIEVSQTFVKRVKFQMLREDAKAEGRRMKKPVSDKRRRRPHQRKIPSSRRH